MAVITVFDRGNLKELDTARKSCPEPEPGLVASFSSPVSALIAGVMFFILGVFSTICVFVGGFSTWQRVLFLVCGPTSVAWGAVLVRRAIVAGGKTARAHRFFYYDNARIVLGTTRPIDRAKVKEIQGRPIKERIQALTSVSPGYSEIPVKAVEYVGLHLGLVKPGVPKIAKMTIKGGGTELLADFDALMPSQNISGMCAWRAFHSISQFYTRLTGNPIWTDIEDSWEGPEEPSSLLNLK
jgi:hypothetical protein